MLRPRTLLVASVSPLFSLLPAILPAQDRAPRQTRGHDLTLERILSNPRSLVPALPPAQWIPGTESFSMLKPGPNKQVVAAFDARGGNEDLFDLDQIKAALAAAGMPGAKTLRRIPLGFRWVDRDTLRLERPDGVYHWNITQTGATKKLSLPPGAGPVACSNHDARAAYLLNHQLFVQQGTDRFAMVQKDGSKDIVYGGAAHRAEFGIHDGLWWGPNERYLAFYREDLSPITAYPYADHTVMPPRPVHGRYPMAGRVHSQVQVGVYDTKRQKLYYLEAEQGADGKAKDVYWTNVTFGPKGQKIYVAIVNRGQDHMDLVRFDLATGKREQVLFSEDDKEWIEPESGPIFLPDKRGSFLWFSPRDGYRHLYLYQQDGTLVRQVTSGRFDVRQFVGFSTARTSAGIAATAAFVMASGADPLEMHLWEVGLRPGDGNEMQRRTHDAGWHSCQVCDSGEFVLDRFSNLQTPGVLQDLNRKGKSLRKMAAPNLIKNMPAQELFQVRTEDGTTLHGHLLLPPDLDPGTKYPLLLYVYGGPHSQLVRNRFLGGGNLWLAYLATRGILVARLDNRGTDNRGIEFSQTVFRQLSNLEVKDQVAAVEQLCKRPYVDRNRIGVHGWSYGGYMTLALMLRAPDLFTCGAAGAPVTDWAQYETGYTERYMDTPRENPDGYKKGSVIPLAKKLKGRLLILHGTGDDTVMWSHSLLFVDRCIDAGVLVDYMPYPMQKHGIRGKDRKHLYKLLTRFFVDHLKP
ncbi:MAG: S9 family peptidase [Planctomycetota bacterium]